MQNTNLDGNRDVSNPQLQKYGSQGTLSVNVVTVFSVLCFTEFVHYRIDRFSFCLLSLSPEWESRSCVYVSVCICAIDVLIVFSPFLSFFPLLLCLILHESFLFSLSFCHLGDSTAYRVGDYLKLLHRQAGESTGIGAGVATDGRHMSSFVG